MKEIILASASPRRKELLQLLDIPFTVEISPVVEEYDQNLDPSDIVLYLSQIKAKPISDKYPDRIVIGSDTTVVKNEQILGKPKDKADAYRMLQLLSNSEHIVMTGVTIYYQNQFESFFSQTKVRFNPLTDKEINRYIGTDEPFDKAGAYALQGKAAKFIHSIHGDFYTVVGLPISQLYQLLKKYLK